MRHALALTIAPLLIRIVLGITFVWAGMGKLTQYFTPTPEQAAVLSTWGVVSPPADLAPDSAPDLTPDPSPEPTPEPTAEPVPDATPEPTPSSEPAVDAEPVRYQTAGAEEVRRVYQLALLVHASANPDEGKMPLWPDAIAGGKLPVYTAWAAAVSELVFGAAILLGFFGRLSSLPIAGTMLAAMWLTQIGPAVQSGDALLGFLPQGVFEIGPGGYIYAMILWQLALFVMALAVLLIGPGAVSIDRMLFGAPGSIEDDDSEGFDDDEEDVQFVKMRRRAADDDDD